MSYLTYYERLPEAMDQAKIEEGLRNLLSERQSIDTLEFLECLYELASRQVRNHSDITPELKQLLNQTVIELWDRNCEQNTEFCIGIIISLCLQEAYEYFLRSKDKIKNKAVLIELNGTIAELVLRILMD